MSTRLADTLLLPSRLDPLPNVAVDALCEGLPVICFARTTGIAAAAGGREPWRRLRRRLSRHAGQMTADADAPHPLARGTGQRRRPRARLRGGGVRLRRLCRADRGTRPSVSRRRARTGGTRMTATSSNLRPGFDPVFMLPRAAQVGAVAQPTPSRYLPRPGNRREILVAAARARASTRWSTPGTWRPRA